jgi:hypothetical protein
MNESIACTLHPANAQIERHLTDSILAELGHTDIATNSWWPNPVDAFQQHVLNPLNGQGNAPPRGSVPPARNPQPLNQNRGPAISPAQLKAQERAARDAKVRAQGAAANNKNHMQVGINNQKAAEEAKRLRALQIWYQTDDSKTGGLSVAQKMQKQRQMSQFSGGPRKK